MGIFQRLNLERGITIVLVTHEPDIAEYAHARRSRSATAASAATAPVDAPPRAPRSSSRALRCGAASSVRDHVHSR